MMKVCVCIMCVKCGIDVMLSVNMRLIVLGLVNEISISVSSRLGKVDMMLSMCVINLLS